MEITYLDGDNGRVPIQSGMEIVAVAGVPIKGFGNILEITYKVINLCFKIFQGRFHILFSC